VKIKSEHVARVNDVGTLPNGAPYMVMEYLDGEDLAAWIKQRGALPIEQAVEFVLQACVAVADAHALGIVHRDLKPSNLFCIRRSDGQLSIKVLDFGISKMTDVAGAGVAMTRTSALMGTPLYMSPEQMRSSKDVDSRTDIWALGAILFELMAGRPAFLAESVTELAIKVNNEPIPSIRGFRPDVAAGLEAVIGKCLEKDRRERYRNVAELALALLPFAPRRAKASVERISGIIQAAGLSESALAVPVSPQVDGAPASPATLSIPPTGLSGGAPPVSDGTATPVMRTPAPMSASPGRMIGDTTAQPISNDRGGQDSVEVTRSSARIVVPVVAIVALLGIGGVVAATFKGEKQAAIPATESSLPALPAVPTIVASASTVAVVPSAQSLPPTVDVTALPVAQPSPVAPKTQMKPLSNNIPSPPARPTPPTTPATNPANGQPVSISSPYVTAAPPTATAPAAPARSAANCDPPYYFDAKGARVFKKECL
jgi:serine/threonine-protein kinase